MLPDYLTVVRHGLPRHGLPKGDLLTQSSVQQLKNVADYLISKEQGIPSHILTSPEDRAVKTAQILKNASGIQDMITLESLHEDKRGIEDKIEFSKYGSNLVIVTHEPKVKDIILDVFYDQLLLKKHFDIPPAAAYHLDIKNNKLFYVWDDEVEIIPFDQDIYREEIQNVLFESGKTGRGFGFTDSEVQKATELAVYFNKIFHSLTYEIDDIDTLMGFVKKEITPELFNNLKIRNLFLKDNQPLFEKDSLKVMKILTGNPDRLEEAINNTEKINDEPLSEENKNKLKEVITYLASANIVQLKKFML